LLAILPRTACQHRNRNPQRPRHRNHSPNLPLAGTHRARVNLLKHLHRHNNHRHNNHRHRQTHKHNHKCARRRRRNPSLKHNLSHNNPQLQLPQPSNPKAANRRRHRNHPNRYRPKRARVYLLLPTDNGCHRQPLFPRHRHNNHNHRKQLGRVRPRKINQHDLPQRHRVLLRCPKGRPNNKTRYPNRLSIRRQQTQRLDKQRPHRSQPQQQ